MEQLGIDRRIRFLAAVKDVSPILGASDIAVISSLMENLSMAFSDARGLGDTLQETFGIEGRSSG